VVLFVSISSFYFEIAPMCWIASLPCALLQWWLISPHISFQFLKAHPWGCCTVCVAEGTSEEFNSLLSLNVWIPLLISCPSLSWLILKLFLCFQRLVEFNATGVLWLELQMIPFSKISCLK
jgi:hypothetical protein